MEHLPPVRILRNFKIQWPDPYFNYFNSVRNLLGFLDVGGDSCSCCRAAISASSIAILFTSLLLSVRSALASAACSRRFLYICLHSFHCSPSPFSGTASPAKLLNSSTTRSFPDGRDPSHPSQLSIHNGGQLRLHDEGPTPTLSQDGHTPKSSQLERVITFTISRWFIPKVREFSQTERRGDDRGSKGCSHQPVIVLYITKISPSSASAGEEHSQLYHRLHPVSHSPRQAMHSISE